MRGPGVSRFFEANDLRFHTVEWPGTDPPLVLLHPNRANARVWDFMVANSKLRNRFVAVDLRGHGQSEWPNKGYQLEDYVKDVIAVIEKLSPSPVILVGGATGGNIGLLVATIRPDLVRGLAVIDPGLSLDPAINARVQDQIEHEHSFSNRTQAVESLPFSSLWSTANKEFYADHAFREQDDGSWEGTYSKTAARETEHALVPEMWDKIRVACPTLAVRGDRSEVFGREKLVRLGSLIADCIIAEIPRSNHRVMQDSPETLAALLDGFAIMLMDG